MASFTQHVFDIHVCCCMYQEFAFMLNHSPLYEYITMCLFTLYFNELFGLFQVQAIRNNTVCTFTYMSF